MQHDEVYIFAGCFCQLNRERSFHSNIEFDYLLRAAHVTVNCIMFFRVFREDLVPCNGCTTTFKSRWWLPPLKALVEIHLLLCLTPVSNWRVKNYSFCLHCTVLDVLLNDAAKCLLLLQYGAFELFLSDVPYRHICTLTILLMAIFPDELGLASCLCLLFFSNNLYTVLPDPNFSNASWHSPTQSSLDNPSVPSASLS